MVLTLYGYPLATCTQRVATVLHEKQVPFKFVNVNLATGEHKAPAYLEKQPFGQVPYIVSIFFCSLPMVTTLMRWVQTFGQDDDGFVLYESRAISRYIAEKYDSQGALLIPKDAKDKALFEQAASIETANFDGFASKAVSEKIFKPA